MNDFGWIFQLDHLIKIALSAGLGALIGLEREYHGRPAGLRTHILVSMGATLLIIGSHSLPEIVNSVGFKGNYVIDPARLAAGIITGIGFLGAGVVIKTKEFIRGVTTAACIWFSASIGIIVGMGFYLLAVGSALIALFVLIALARVRDSIYPHSYRRIVVITRMEDPQQFTEKCRQILLDHKVTILDIDYILDNKLSKLTLSFYIRSRKQEIGANLIQLFGKLPGVMETSIQ